MQLNFVQLNFVLGYIFFFTQVFILSSMQTIIFIIKKYSIFFVLVRLIHQFRANICFLLWGLLLRNNWIMSRIFPLLNLQKCTNSHHTRTEHQQFKEKNVFFLYVCVGFFFHFFQCFRSFSLIRTHLQDLFYWEKMKWKTMKCDEHSNCCLFVVRWCGKVANETEKKIYNKDKIIIMIISCMYNEINTKTYNRIFIYDI